MFVHSRQGEADCFHDAFEAVANDTQRLYDALSPWRFTRAVVMLLRFGPLLALVCLMALTGPAHPYQLIILLACLASALALIAFVMRDLLVGTWQCSVLTWRGCCVPACVGCGECGSDCAHGLGIV